MGKIRRGMSDTDRQLLLALERERDRYKKALEEIVERCDLLTDSIALPIAVKALRCEVGQW